MADQSQTPEATPRHEDDGEGGCVICREWVPFTDDTYVRIPFPCAPSNIDRLRRIEAASERIVHESAFTNFGSPTTYPSESALSALRAALEEKP